MFTSSSLSSTQESSTMTHTSLKKNYSTDNVLKFEKKVLWRRKDDLFSTELKFNFISFVLIYLLARKLLFVRWNNTVYTYHTYISFVLIYLPARELLFVRWNNTVYTYHTYVSFVLIYLPARELLFVRLNNAAYTYHRYDRYIQYYFIWQTIIF
jgi:hypothetical protein